MKSLFSILLSCILLFSTMGMAKTTHWCMGHEMESSIGFGAKHLDCGMNMAMEHSETGDNSSEDPNSCCENTTQHLQVDDDFQLKSLDFQIDFQSIPLVFYFLQVNFNFLPFVKQVLPGVETPPLILQDFQILFQTFLI